MTFAHRPTSRRPVGRGFVLLVMVVLAGLLGMHALAPAQASVQASVQRAGAGHMGAQHAETGHGMTAGTPDEDPGCSHTSGGGGHLEHADATCAAAGVSDSYAPPALTSAGLDQPPVTASAAGAVATSTVSGRAPPDLAELQLLRI